MIRRCQATVRLDNYGPTVQCDEEAGHDGDHFHKIGDGSKIGDGECSWSDRVQEETAPVSTYDHCTITVSDRPTFHAYATEVLQYGVYPENRRLEYPAHGLAGEVSEVAEYFESVLAETINYIRMVRHAGASTEIIKKMIRDDGGVLNADRRAKLLKELGDVLWYVAAVAADAGSSLEEVAQINRTKLAERNAKGLIHGEGSGR